MRISLTSFICFRSSCSRLYTWLFSFLFCLVLLAGSAWGQAGAGLLAPPEAMDTLSGGPVGPGPGTMPQAFPAAPGTGPQAFPAQPGVPGQPAAMPGMEGAPAPFSQQAPTIDVFKEVERYNAIEGQRIIDAASYNLNPAAPEILDDPVRLEITDTAGYSDDGRTLGDEEADDKFYSKVNTNPVVDEYIGGLSHYFLRKNLNMLRAAQGMNPLNFFGLSAVTNERFSAVESQRERVAERDSKVYLVDDDGMFMDCWSERFLDPYRQTEGDPESEFYSLYVPKPPPAPPVEPPPGWMPPQSIKVGLEGEVERALNIYRNQNPDGLSEEELDATIAELRTTLLESESERDAFFEQYPPGETGGAGMGSSNVNLAPTGETVGKGYYQVPEQVYEF